MTLHSLDNSILNMNCEQLIEHIQGYKYNIQNLYDWSLYNFIKLDLKPAFHYSRYAMQLTGGIIGLLIETDFDSQLGYSTLTVMPSSGAIADAAVGLYKDYKNSHNLPFRKRIKIIKPNIGNTK